MGKLQKANIQINLENYFPFVLANVIEFLAY